MPCVPASLASVLPLLPALSVGDLTGITIVVLFLLVSLWLLVADGRLRAAQIVAVVGVGALALGFLLGLGASTEGRP